MSNPYSYTDANSESQTAVFVAARPFAIGKGAAPQKKGFTRVDGTLVPNTFIKEVESQLIGARMTCGECTPVSDYFKPHFLETLNAKEFRVLGDIVFFLVDKGCVKISLDDMSKEAA